MITFIKPENLNGAELLDELKAAGIIVTGAPHYDGINDLLLDIDVKDESKAAKIIAKHDGTMVAAEPTIVEKLANAGISLDDLKVALGI